MFQQELEELLALSEADKLGKEYYEQTGIVLSGEVIDETMIQRLMKAGGLEHYMDIQKDGLDALILAASKVIYQEVMRMTVERFIASKNPSKAQLAMQEMLRDIAVDKSYSKMMRLRLRGDAESECHDVYYTAMDGDRAVSRHWMGWGKHANAIGNWGNFLTIEEYRGKGIGGSVLKKWWDDLHSPDHCPLPLGFLGNDF